MTKLDIILSVLGIIFLFLPSIPAIISKIADKGKTISLELGEAFLQTSKTFESVDNAIKNDNKIDANELNDIIAQGKKAVIDFKDVIISIKPKQ